MFFERRIDKRILINAHLLLFFSAVWAQSSFAQALPRADQIPVWKTINIGTFRSVINLREALEASECGMATPINSTNLARAATMPCKLGDSANEILGRPGFELSRTPSKIELVLVSGKDLGFRSDSQPSLSEIYERAQSFGFALCPPEAGPQLRLQYTNQKIGEFLPIAMRPIRDYAGELTILSVGNGGAGLLLVGSGGNPDVQIPATAYFVFMRSPLPPDRAIARESDGEVIERVLDEPAARE
jgi:hypothetical protein